MSFNRHGLGMNEWAVWMWVGIHMHVLWVFVVGCALCVVGVMCFSMRLLDVLNCYWMNLVLHYLRLNSKHLVPFVQVVIL